VPGENREIIVMLGINKVTEEIYSLAKTLAIPHQ
jgi:hypothetical protein